MKPINFKDANTQIAKDQEEYNTLPALMIDDQYGTMITCTHLSIKERIKVLFTGRIWMSEWTFKQKITPRRMSTKGSDLYLLPRKS